MGFQQLMGIYWNIVRYKKHLNCKYGNSSRFLWGAFCWYGAWTNSISCDKQKIGFWSRIAVRYVSKHMFVPPYTDYVGPQWSPNLNDPCISEPISMWPVASNLAEIVCSLSLQLLTINPSFKDHSGRMMIHLKSTFFKQKWSEYKCNIRVYRGKTSNQLRHVKQTNTHTTHTQHAHTRNV